MTPREMTLVYATVEYSSLRQREDKYGCFRFATPVRILTFNIYRRIKSRLNSFRLKMFQGKNFYVECN